MDAVQSAADFTVGNQSLSLKDLLIFLPSFEKTNEVAF